jgi:hypothetical protein
MLEVNTPLSDGKVAEILTTNADLGQQSGPLKPPVLAFVYRGFLK